MFSKAYKIACDFTRPLIVTYRFFDGTVECAIATFVILNREGWVITAAHNLHPYLAFKQHQQERDQFEHQFQAIKDNTSMEPEQRAKALDQMKPNPKWITDFSFWWGHDQANVTTFELLSEADLAVGRLDGNYDPDSVGQYPVIMDPAEMAFGTSLCKLGYPFHNPRATFDEKARRFVFAPGVLPAPVFPIDGIYTRKVINGKTQDGRYDIEYIETSTPGLKGQSGGPIFDLQGRIWGIQSRTMHMPLGYSPQIVRNGQMVEENQFLNVGWGIHASLLVQFLRDNGVAFDMPSK